MIEQGTPEWHEQRRGKVTASRIEEVVAKTKSGGYGASRANYMAELLAERLSGVVAESFTSKPMQWGIDHEPEARAAYEFYRDMAVTSAGFVPHPSIRASGASPDGYVGSEGLVEIKCPNTATHIDTLLGKPTGAGYISQMQWQMACTGRQWVDFASYDPRLPPALRLHVQRMNRNDALITELEAEVAKFLDELDAREAKLRAKAAA